MCLSALGERLLGGAVVAADYLGAPSSSQPVGGYDGGSHPHKSSVLE